MVETAAQLAEHVLLALPMRQWALAVPKRQHYFLRADSAGQDVVLRISLRVVERCLFAHGPGRSRAARLGTVIFIHRFGSLLDTLVFCFLDATSVIANRFILFIPEPHAEAK